MKTSRLVLFLLLAAPLCAEDAFLIRFAICYPAKPSKPALKVLRKYAKKELAGTAVYKAVTKKGQLPYMIVQSDPKGYRMPNPSDMVRFGQGVTQADAERLQAPAAITQIDYMGHRDHALDAVKESAAAALAAAEAGGGFIWDDHTHQMYSVEAWRKLRVKSHAGHFPRVPKHVTLHVYPDGGGYRAVSLGMAKFAAPDLVVESFPRSWRDDVVRMMQALCQVTAPSPPRKTDGQLILNLNMIQHTDMRKEFLAAALPSAQKFAVLNTTSGKHRPGDADNPLLELNFQAATGDTREERLAATLQALFGSKNTSEQGPATDQMKARREQILADLPALQALAGKGLPTGERLMVKAPFVDEAKKKREWMWVEVITWRDDLVTGVLTNQPVWIQTLKVGSKVSFHPDQIHDYMHHLANGEVLGSQQ